MVMPTAAMIPAIVDVAANLEFNLAVYPAAGALRGRDRPGPSGKGTGPVTDR
jgi:hypothetical protein